MRTVRRLQLSPGMIARATRQESRLEKPSTQRVAPSGLFISKRVTDRAAGKDNLDTILANGLNSSVVLKKMQWQSQNQGVARAANFCRSVETFADAGNAAPSCGSSQRSPPRRPERRRP